MRTRIFAPLMALIALATLSLHGCGGNDPVAPKDNSAVLKSASSNTGLFSNPPDSSKKDPTGGGGRDTSKKDPTPRPVNFEQILRQLNLTPAQAESAKRCLAAYRECVQSTTTRYNTAKEELIKRGRNAIAEVKAAFANGRITAEDARAQIKEIEAKTKRALAELEAAFNAAVRKCRAELNDCLKSVLTDEQWRKWLALTA